MAGLKKSKDLSQNNSLRLKKMRDKLKTTSEKSIGNSVYSQHNTLSPHHVKNHKKFMRDIIDYTINTNQKIIYPTDIFEIIDYQ